MADINKILLSFIDDELRLSQKDVEKSAASREWLLNRISNVIANSDEHPNLYSPEPFVNFGSYFKGTKVSNVDEYDELVVLDSYTGVYSSNGQAIGSGLGTSSPNKKYSSSFMKDDGSGVSPTKQLNWLKKIVSSILVPLGGEAPIKDGQAVTATLKSSDLKIDLVPAGIFSSKTRANTVFYNIPAGNDTDGWIETNPKIDKEIIANTAKNRDNFKNLIRLFKFIRDRHHLDISSFALECAAVHYAQQSDWYYDFYANTKEFFEYLRSCFLAKKIADITNTSKNLLAAMGESNAKNIEVDLHSIQIGLMRQKIEADEQQAKKEVYRLLMNLQESEKVGNL